MALGLGLGATSLPIMGSGTLNNTFLRVDNILFKNEIPSINEVALNEFDAASTNFSEYSQSIAYSGDVLYEVDIDNSSTDKDFMIGATENATFGKWNSVNWDYGIWVLDTGEVQIITSGSLGSPDVSTTLSYSEGDVLQIRKVGTTITAEISNSIIHTWASASASDLYFYVCPTTSASGYRVRNPRITQEQNTNDVDVIILTGQSNALGVGLNSSATASELLLQSGVKIYNTSLSGFQQLDIPDNNIGSNSTQHGLELGFSSSPLTYGNRPIHLIKWAVSGTDIDEHLSGGSVYTTLFNNYVQPTINYLVNNGYTPRVTLVFMQGEADSNSQPLTDAYADKLDTWVDLWRNNLGISLPIIITEIYENDTRDEQINNVFSSLGSSDARVSIIDTSTRTSSDNLHWDYTSLKGIANDILTTKDALNGGIRITSTI